MINDTRAYRLFYSIFTLVIVLHLFLIFRQTLYPFLDIPEHLAAAVIYKYYSNPDSLFSDYYAVHIFLKPNIIHLLFCGSAVFGSVLTANKVFLSLYVILLPVSSLMVIKKLNGNIWYALFVFPFLYNYNLMMGFVGYAFAVPLVILFLYLLSGYDDSTPTRKLTLCLYFILLYFVHALAFLFALLVFAVFCLYRLRTIKKTFPSLVLAIPAALLLAAWWLTEPGRGSYPGLFDFLGGYYLHDYLPTLLKRARLIAFDNYRLFPRYEGYATGIFFFTATVGPALYGLLRNRINLYEQLIHHRLEPVYLFLVCALACFFFLPAGLPGQSYLYHRFSVFVILILIIIGATLSPSGFNRKQIIAVTALCFLHFGLYFDYFRDFDRVNESFNADFFAEIQPDQRLVGMITDKEFRGHSVYIHFPDYFIVFNRGINATCLTKHRFGAIRRRTTYRNLAPYEEDMRDSTIINDFYPYMDYILGRGKFPVMFDRFRYNFHEIKNADGWSLYKRNNNRALLPGITGSSSFNPQP